MSKNFNHLKLNPNMRIPVNSFYKEGDTPKDRAIKTAFARLNNSIVDAHNEKIQNWQEQLSFLNIQINAILSKYDVSDKEGVEILNLLEDEDKGRLINLMRINDEIEQEMVEYFDKLKKL